MWCCANGTIVPSDSTPSRSTLFEQQTFLEKIGLCLDGRTQDVVAILVRQISLSNFSAIDNDSDPSFEVSLPFTPTLDAYP